MARAHLLACLDSLTCQVETTASVTWLSRRLGDRAQLFYQRCRVGAFQLFPEASRNSALRLQRSQKAFVLSILSETMETALSPSLSIPPWELPLLTSLLRFAPRVSLSQLDTCRLHVPSGGHGLLPPHFLAPISLPVRNVSRPHSGHTPPGPHPLRTSQENISGSYLA